MDEYPHGPFHTCVDNGVGVPVVTVRESSIVSSFVVKRNWRDTPKAGAGCPACYHDRAFRICKQIETEQQAHALFMSEMSERHYQKLVNRWRQRRKIKGVALAYIAFPAGQSVVVIHNQKKESGNEVPSNKGHLFSLISRLADTDTGARIRSSDGFGEHWQGMRGDGRVRYDLKQGIDNRLLFTGVSYGKVATL